MEKKDLIIGVVGLTVCVIVAATVLMPILSDATKTTDTYTNEGYYKMSHFDNTTDHSFSWTYESPNVVTVDNQEVVISGILNKDVTIIADTNWLVRLSTDASGNVLRLSLVLSSGGTTTASVSDSHTISMTLESGAMSTTFAGTNKTASYDDVWIISNDGDMIMKKADVDSYLNGDSQVVGYGLTRIRNNAGGLTGSPGVGMMFIGSYDDGITGTVWRGGDNVSLSDETMNTVVDSSHIDLYKFSSITATATLTETVDDETVTTDTAVTYNYVIVPYEVTAERSIHFDTGTNAIINAIPIIIIVAMITMAVGFFLVKRE